MIRFTASALFVMAACGSHNNSGPTTDGATTDGTTADTPAATTDGGSGDAPPCGTLKGTIRDFVGVETPGYHGTASPAPTPHPDFEHTPADGSVSITGLVLADLDTTTHKPQLNTASPDLAAAFITSADSYAEWYTDTPNVSARIDQEFPLVETGSNTGIYAFDTTRYFPIDNLGWGIEYSGSGSGTPEVDDDGTPRNFHLTTEFHATFQYMGGEKFSFRGDDDVWVFINNKLAIDIGGIHGPIGEQVDLDAETETDLDGSGDPETGSDHVHPLDLGISTGNTYPIDFFQAERHVTGSNFLLQTSIQCLNTVIF